MDISKASRTKKLTSVFFNRPTVKVARDLIDKYLITNYDGKVCGGRIVETEAYLGCKDNASHASCGITKRNYLMYGKPGRVYVYLIYGMYYCFNLTCEKEGTPGAVLIRAIQPEIGVEEMKKRRGSSDIASGPGKLSIALKIDISDNGVKIPSKNIYILSDNKKPREIGTSARIGVPLIKSNERDYRFYVKNCKFVSGNSKIKGR